MLCLATLRVLFLRSRKSIVRNTLRRSAKEVISQNLSSKELFTVTNVIFLAGGVYFALLAAIGQASLYAFAPAILCFISFAISLREDLFFANPFRIATAIFVLVLLFAQEYASLSTFIFDSVVIASIIVNGVLFFLFIGCTLSVASGIVRVETEEEEEEEEKTKPTKQVRQPS